ncbi:MAG: hypothetical protein MRJ93_09555 [Nitrososphaeraceae archaeon]|nr:hypothetical protein [Nitrososphaeraceae archaeon]
MLDLNFIISLSFLIIIIFKLFNWFKHNKNKIILLYALSFSLFSIHIITGLAYLHVELAYKNEVIKPLPTRLLFMVIFSTNDQITLLTDLFDLTFISSFILTWIATSLLLKQYTKKLGRVIFWILICLPLIYLFFSYELLIYYITGQHISIYSHLVESNINKFIPLDLLDIFFRSPKQIGGIFFGIIFWIISTKINDDKFKQNMLTTSIGIIFLYSSTGIYPIILTAVPPHGILMLPFLVLGTYMITIGIFNTAINISTNIELRKKIYNSIEKDFDLLKNLGVSQMEVELEEQYKKITNMVDKKELENSEDYDMSPKNVKGLINDILTEMNKRKLHSK